MEFAIDRPSLKRARIATTLIFLVQGLSMGAWAASIAAIQLTLGLADGALSIALFAYAMGGLAGMPLSAWLVSRLGSHLAMIAVAFSYCFVLTLPGLTTTFIPLVLAALTLGLGKGVLDVSMNSFAADIQEAWGQAIMSSFHAAASFGGFLGAIWLGLALGNGFSVAAGLLCLSVLSLGVVIFANGLSQASLSLPLKTERAPAFVRPPRSLLALGALCLLVMMIEGGVADWSGVYLTTVVLASPASAALAYASFSIAMLVGRLFGDGFVRRFGERTTLFAGAISALTGFVCVLGTATFLPSIFGFALVGLGASNIVPLLFSSASRLKDVSSGSAIAMTAAIGYTGFLMGPLIIGFLSDQFGLRIALIVLLGAAFLIGTLGPRQLRPRNSAAT
ncbi:MAG: MFS transporter [Pseudomonadota bacterium]